MTSKDYGIKHLEMLNGKATETAQGHQEQTYFH